MTTQSLPRSQPGSGDDSRVGFVGLGDIGAPMAQRLLDVRGTLHMWARRASSLRRFDTGATVQHEFLADLGRACNVVGICVNDDAAATEVITTLFEVVEAGTVLVIHSTVAPSTCQQLEAAAPTGVHVIDAPVSGGSDAAARGQLAIFVGGATTSFERCRPVLDALAKDAVHVGPLGTGQVVKLFNNALYAAQAGLAANLLTIGDSLGIPAGLLLERLVQGSAQSHAMTRLARLADPGVGAGYATLLRKDLGLFQQVLLDSGIQEPATARVAQAFLDQLEVVHDSEQLPVWAVSP